MQKRVVLRLLLLLLLLLAVHLVNRRYSSHSCSGLPLPYRRVLERLRYSARHLLLRQGRIAPVHYWRPLRRVCFGEGTRNFEPLRAGV